ncbi:MAG TPA: protein kinase [Terriglobia bacterium]|nr:protein kinase [Terriglobia bacterium]
MIGERLAHYEIQSLLGSGGMGEVYRARDTKLNRDVAVKVLPPEFAQDSDRVARFHREAQVIAALNHPNIAAIHQLEESASTKFLVLESVEGETLAERIHRGPLPVEDALHIAQQICEALEAAHEKGVIHRDLKPRARLAPAQCDIRLLLLAQRIDRMTFAGSLMTNTKRSSLPGPNHFRDAADTGVACIEIVLLVKSIGKTNAVFHRWPIPEVRNDVME